MKAPQDAAPTISEREPPNKTDKAKIIVEPARTAKRERYALVAVMALGVVTFFFGLGNLALVGPDEPRYAEVAREMFATGDYISTRLCGCLWFEKPALIYWSAAGSYNLFGVDEFAARFPSAMFALATVCFIYFVLRRIASFEIAITSSTMLATCGIFIAYARVSTPDMALAATMSVSLLSAFWATLAESKKSLSLWIISFAAMGLAMLAKGLVAILLIPIIIISYVLITRRWHTLSLKNLAIAFAIFVAIAATWYVPVTAKHGWQFVEEFFIRHHFERYTSNAFGHPQPFYFFFLVAFAGIAPWSFFLLPAIRRASRLRPRANDVSSLLIFAWLWLIVPLVFFSLSGSKLPGYILMVFPPLAIIIGYEVEQIWNGKINRLLKLATWLTAALVVAIAAGFVIYSMRGRAAATGLAFILYALPLVFATCAVFVLVRRNVQRFMACTSLVIASVIVGAVVLLFPKLSDELSLKSLSLEAAAAMRPGEKITFFIRKEFAPVFYARGQVVCDVGESGVLNALKQDILVDALRQYPSLIVITGENWIDDLVDDGRFNMEFVARQGDAHAFRVTLK